MAENENKLQELFNKFVENCIVKNGTLLTEPTNGVLFTTDNLNTTKGFLDGIIEAKNEKSNKNNAESEDKYGVSHIFNVSDPLWEKDKYKDNQEVIIKILLHCYWLMYLGSDRLNMQPDTAGYYVDNAKENYFDNIKCVWAIGQTFTRDPLGSMSKIVNMVIFLKDLKVTTETAKVEIINYWSQQQEDRNSNVANILLYFCDSEHFLPIPSFQNKKKICKNLKSLINKDESIEKDLPEGMSDLDKDLYKIRQNLLKNYGELNQGYEYSSGVKLNGNNPFWHQNIKPFWEDTTSNLKGELSLEDLLEYKKALVLYGPPGTSKSYSAKEIAKNIIARAIRNTDNYTANIKNFSSICDNHIHPLQFHPNYTYDDFIIGKTIQKNSVEVKYGWLLELIDKITKNKSNDNLPHIIILDEINRVDISRVFGELLTAMEPAHRKEGVELSIKDKNSTIYLKVPENMYFIGTMNQIDFSLEQVDFALRRRFIWQLSTYNKDTLEHIIESKNDGSIPPDRIDEYSSLCTKLNNVIKDNENLGESYWIGHTYFAEIVNIYKQIKENGKDDWDAAKNVLWQISIRPTLEAYCGTMDAKAREDFITKCEDKFMPKDNKSKSQKKNDSSTDSENPK